ncbi:MAG: hypothetical protein ABL963_04485 [Longimicrobiales bacterium]
MPTSNTGPDRSISRAWGGRAVALVGLAFGTLLGVAACSEAPAPPARTTLPSESASLLSLCASTAPECQTYLPIWRELVIARSGIDVPYFDAHVVPLTASIDTWNDGRSLRVRYRFTIDWASFEREDVMIVFIDPSAAPYPSLGVPLGTPLDAAQIARAADGSAWGTSVSAIQRVDALGFRSQDEALAALRAHPDGGALQPQEISFNRPGMFPRENGHPHLHARSAESLTANQCASGMIDLVTGEIHVTVDACRMTGGPTGPGGRGIVP